MAESAWVSCGELLVGTAVDAAASSRPSVKIIFFNGSPVYI
jgi:hypothetical protein